GLSGPDDGRGAVALSDRLGAAGVVEIVLYSTLVLALNLVFAFFCFFFFKQKTAYEIGLGIPAEPLFRSSTPLIRLFLLVLILLLMPTLNFLPVWFALSLLRFRLPSRLPMMFILWMVAMVVVIIPSRTV